MESGMDVSMQIDDSHRSMAYDEAELKKVLARILPPSPQKTQKNIFSGNGQRLAAASNNTSSLASTSDWPTFPIDSDQPTTRLQIRFNGNQR